jgi:hypothetical protein
MSRHLFIAILLCAAALAATPKEAVGFRGSVEGKVKSAKPDGSSFVLTVTKADPEEKSTVKDGSAMVGKEITLGVRMPRKDGKPYPSPEDEAWIKTLKPGANVRVKVFAVAADPTVLRIQGPGETIEENK